jgi:hypothetical protein
MRKGCMVLNSTESILFSSNHPQYITQVELNHLVQGEQPVKLPGQFLRQVGW